MALVWIVDPTGRASEIADIWVDQGSLRLDAHSSRRSHVLAVSDLVQINRAGRDLALLALDGGHDLTLTSLRFADESQVSECVTALLIEYEAHTRAPFPTGDLTSFTEFTAPVPRRAADASE